MEEQNYEYEQCVLADLEKQFERHNQELLKQVIIDTWKEERTCKALRMSKEPAKTEPNTMTIAFRVKKSGTPTRIIRRFKNHDTLQDLMDFVDCLDAVEPLNSVRVCTTMPLQTLESSMEPLNAVFPGLKELSLIVEIE